MKLRILYAVIFMSIILCSNASAQYLWVPTYSGSSEPYESKVLKLDSEGNLIKEIIVPMTTGHIHNVITVDPRGYVWVVNISEPKIYKVSFDGTVECSNVLSAGTIYCGEMGLALDTSYNPIVATTTSVKETFFERFNDNNCASMLTKMGPDPKGSGEMAIDSLNNIWISQWDDCLLPFKEDVYKYNSSFDFIGFAIDAWPGDVIFGLAIDANNNMVANFSNGALFGDGLNIRTFDQNLAVVGNAWLGMAFGLGGYADLVVDSNNMRYGAFSMTYDFSFSRTSMTGDIIEEYPLPAMAFGSINLDFYENLWISSTDYLVGTGRMVNTSKTGTILKNLLLVNLPVGDFGNPGFVWGDFTGYKFVHGTLGGVNTPVGTNVQVPQGGGTITFDTVSAEGLTSIAARAKGQGAPSGFRVGAPPQYYDITTTATFSGNVEVCLMYDDAYFSQPEASLRLFHRSGSWADITTSVDDVNNIICGVTTSFSQFAIAEPLPTDCGPGLACYGDGDGDLVVDITDVNMVRDASLLLNPDYSMVYPSNGDTQEVSGGGVVDVTDVNAIRDWALLRSNALALAARPSVITVINPPSSISAAAGQAVLVQVEVTNSSAVARSGVGVVFEVISGSAHIEDGEGDASLFPDPDNIGFNFTAGSRFSVTGAILKNGRAAVNVIIDGPGPITIRARVPKTLQRDLPNSIFTDINLEGL